MQGHGCGLGDIDAQARAPPALQLTWLAVGPGFQEEEAIGRQDVQTSRDPRENQTRDERRTGNEHLRATTLAENHCEKNSAGRS